MPEDMVIPNSVWRGEFFVFAICTISIIVNALV